MSFLWKISFIGLIIYFESLMQIRFEQFKVDDKFHGKKSWKHVMNLFFRPSFLTKMVMWTPNSCWPRKRPWTTPRPPWPPLNLIPNLWKRLTPPLQRRNPQPKNPSPLTEKVSLVLKNSNRQSFAQERVKIASWHVSMVCDSSYLELIFIGFILFRGSAFVENHRETKLL